MERENGIVIGIVHDLDDQDQLGRIRVRFPHLNDEVSDWARLATPMAGKDRGLFMRPEIGDEVLIAFEHGDPRRSYVVGSLWSKVDTPPADDGQPVDNNWRFFRSRSGHLLKFDDTSGSERIEIVGKGDKHKVVVDVSGDKIEVSCSSGDIKVSAPNGKVAIDAREIELKATSTMTLDGGTSMTIKAQQVSIN